MAITLDEFGEIWLVDFEFVAKPGERPDAVCMVAKEARSGRLLRLWDEDLRANACPVPLDRDVLYVAYSAAADACCHLALGWPLPTNVLDLYVEFRNLTNGGRLNVETRGSSLLAALAFFGLSGIAPVEKDYWRTRILAGRPYSAADAAGILDYCESDVHALQALLPRVCAAVALRPHWLEHALLRGRYIKACARIEHAGVPLDLVLLRKLVKRWDWLKRRLIDDIRAAYPIFDGATLKMARFERWLAGRRIPWPRTETGQLSLSEDTFKVMSRAFPELAPIREVRDNLSQLRLSELAVGADGRNRTSIWPFSTRSSRNAPSNTKFIFGPSVWLRSLIRPDRDRSLAYIDWSSQEIGIAAALSGDEALTKAYCSGDPYLAFAKDARLAPPEATKATHKSIRDRCKAVVLGTLYGMQYPTLAARLDIPVIEARQLLEAHRRVYARFWRWSQAAVDHGMLHGFLDTVFGWRLHVNAQTRVTSLLNHPMQANGAEMLRLACSFATEAGIRVCAPVHDALLIEASRDEIQDAVALTCACMARASRIVLAGFDIRTEAEFIHYPDRYTDERGARMWQMVTGLLAVQPLDARFVSWPRGSYREFRNRCALPMMAG